MLREGVRYCVPVDLLYFAHLVFGFWDMEVNLRVMCVGVAYKRCFSVECKLCLFMGGFCDVFATLFATLGMSYILPASAHQRVATLTFYLLRFFQAIL